MGDLIDRIGTQFVVEGLNDIESGWEKLKRLGLEAQAAGTLVGKTVEQYDAATGALKRTTVEADTAARTFTQVQKTYQDVDLVAEQHAATQERVGDKSKDLAGKLILLEGTLNAVKIGTNNLRQVAQSLDPDLAKLAAGFASATDAGADMAAGMMRYQKATGGLEKAMAGLPVAANAIALAVQATNAIVKDIDAAAEHYERFSKTVQFSGMAARNEQNAINKAIREGWTEAAKYADVHDRAAAAVAFLAAQLRKEREAADETLKPHAERIAQMDAEIDRLKRLEIQMRKARGETLSKEEEREILSPAERMMTGNERGLKKMSEDWEKHRAFLDDLDESLGEGLSRLGAADRVEALAKATDILSVYQRLVKQLTDDGKSLGQAQSEASLTMADQLNAVKALMETYPGLAKEIAAADSTVRVLNADGTVTTRVMGQIGDALVDVAKKGAMSQEALAKWAKELGGVGQNVKALLEEQARLGGSDPKMSDALMKDAENTRAWAQAEIQRLQEREEYVPESLKMVAGVYDNNAQNMKDWAESQIEELRKLNKDVPAELRLLAETYKDFDANRKKAAMDTYSWEEKSQGERRRQREEGQKEEQRSQEDYQRDARRSAEAAGMTVMTGAAGETIGLSPKASPERIRQVAQNIAASAGVAPPEIVAPGATASAGGGFGVGGAPPMFTDVMGTVNTRSGFGGNETKYVTIQSAMGAPGGLMEGRSTGPTDVGAAMLAGGVSIGQGTGGMGDYGPQDGGGILAGILAGNTKVISEGGIQAGSGGDISSGSGIPASVIAGANAVIAERSEAAAAMAAQAISPVQMPFPVDTSAYAGKSAAEMQALLARLVALQEDGGYF